MGKTLAPERTGVAPKDCVAKLFVTTVTKGQVTPEGKQIYTWRFTDETLDRDGEIIPVDGWDFDAYSKNPVFLDSHPWCGTVLDIVGGGIGAPRLVAGAWEIDMTFATTDHAKQAQILVDENYCRTVSVGFRSLEQDRTPGQPMKHLKKELMEISLVAIPSNPNALRVRGLGADAFRQSGGEGKTFQLPGKAMDFNQALETDEKLSELYQRRWEIWDALQDSLSSIVTDDDLDLSTKIRLATESLAQFSNTWIQWVTEWVALMAKQDVDSLPSAILGYCAPRRDEMVRGLAPIAPVHNVVVNLGDLSKVLDQSFLLKAAAPGDGPTDETKGGKKLSTATMKCLKAALDCHKSGVGMLEELIADASAEPDEEPPAPGDDKKATTFLVSPANGGTEGKAFPTKEEAEQFACAQVHGEVKGAWIVQEVTDGDLTSVKMVATFDHWEKTDDGVIRTDAATGAKVNAAEYFTATNPDPLSTKGELGADSAPVLEGHEPLVEFDVTKLLEFAKGD